MFLTKKIDTSFIGLRSLFVVTDCLSGIDWVLCGYLYLFCVLLFFCHFPWLKVINELRVKITKEKKRLGTDVFSHSIELGTVICPCMLVENIVGLSPLIQLLSVLTSSVSGEFPTICPFP